MNKLKHRENSENARLLDTEQLCAYVGLGRMKAREIGEDAGAVIRVGKRLLFDRKKVDKYLDEMTQ